LPLLGLPQAIEEICLLCLSREPDHRPLAGELAQILSREVHRIDDATIRLGEHASRSLARGAALTLPLNAPRRRRTRPRPRPRRRVMVGATALLSALAVGYAVRAVGPQPTVAQAQGTMMTPCAVTYSISPTLDGQFEAALTVTNTTAEPVPQWIVVFSRPGGLSTTAAQAGRANLQQLAVNSSAQVSQQSQTVTLASASTLEAGASVTQALHGRYAGQPDGMPGAFTLNGKRCDAIVIFAATLQPQATVGAAPSVVAQTSTWNKYVSKHQPSKPHRKRPERPAFPAA
jgi:hypothetical protein